MIKEVDNYSYSRNASPRLGSRITSRAESTRRPAKIYANYRRHNPRRQLDWRWQRAGELFKYGEEPDPVFDDGWTRRAYAYRQLADNAGDTLADTMPDLHAAYQLKAAGGATCWELEARILSRETPQDIEVKTCIAASVVECYEKTFFNVLSRIDCLAYVTDQAIGQQPFDGRNVAAIWNHFAYRFGPHFLDLVVDDFRETGKSDYTHLSFATDWSKGRSQLQRTLDRAIALLMFTVTRRNFVALLRVQAAVMAMQQAGESAAQDNGIEDFVDDAMSGLFSTTSDTEVEATVDATDELVA